MARCGTACRSRRDAPCGPMTEPHRRFTVTYRIGRYHDIEQTNKSIKCSLLTEISVGWASPSRLTRHGRRVLLVKQAVYKCSSMPVNWFPHVPRSLSVLALLS